ncbi:MAG: hypothetical protein NG740_00985 [Omnitrophica bacterium]|nr:hypothetical protein [Candidatus Omnitrophota bacterium]
MSKKLLLSVSVFLCIFLCGCAAVERQLNPRSYWKKEINRSEAYLTALKQFEIDTLLEIKKKRITMPIEIRQAINLGIDREMATEMRRLELKENIELLKELRKDIKEIQEKLNQAKYELSKYE